MSSAAMAVTDGTASDDELVRAARGDRARFADIYERYRLPVYRYVRAMGASDDQAADITASAFERAIRSLGGYRGGPGGLAAWLCRIARNAYLNERRRDRRLAGPMPADLDAGGSSDVHAAELRDMVARLPGPTREAITLRYAAGLTAREIGVVLGKRPDAVQKLIERGLDSLKEALHDAR